MAWIAEIWKWLVANLNNWFVMFWWFIGPVFLASAAARHFLWPRLAGRESGWGALALLAITASWPGDWRRLAREQARAGRERRFLLAIVLARGLPVYTLLFIFALGKEYLLVYLIGLAVFLGLLLPAGGLLRFAGKPPVDETQPAATGRASIPGALGRELACLTPRFVHGLLTAAVLAALAIHPDWVFPVEITGGGLVPQLINGLIGMVVAVGAWTPPVGAILLSVPLWRGGIALTGLLAFFFVVPISPQAMASYGRWLGRRQSLRLAALVALTGLVAAVLTTWLTALLGIDMPYVYAASQLWQPS